VASPNAGSNAWSRAGGIHRTATLSKQSFLLILFALHIQQTVAHFPQLLLQLRPRNIALRNDGALPGAVGGLHFFYLKILPAPFVMELPAYHAPSPKGVLLSVWERVWAFLKKAGTILFLCCAVMWFLGNFGFAGGNFGLVDAEDSLLAVIGGAIAFIFKPLGFGTWQAVASSLSGFVAKEGIVSTMGVLSGLGEIEGYSAAYQAQFAAFFPSMLAAFSFMVFNLFDSPCLAALSTTAKEMNNRQGK
jgi:Fe2+ transport system protein B